MLNFNFMKLDKFCQLNRIFVGLMASLMLFGCGVESGAPGEGGSSDGQQVTLEGTLKDSSGNLLAQVEISLVQSGASAITDASGAFSFGQIEQQGAVQFVVQGAAFSALSNQLEIAETASTLNVSLTLSSDQQSAQAALAQDGGGDSGSPSEPGTPGATPTPDTIPSTGFDSSGNTKDFGIPAPYIGNVSRGRRKYAERCGACHSNLEGRGLSFSQLKRTIAASPMFITMHDASLADIVAYLRK